MTIAPVTSDPDRTRAVWALTAVLRGRRFIIGSAIGLAFLVGVVLLLRDRTYTSSATLLPVVGRTGGNLAGLAASLGFNLSAGDLNQNPAFYSELVETPTILLPIVERNFGDSSRPATLQDLFDIDESTPALRSEMAMRELRERLHVTLKARTGVVRIDATLESPELAQAVVLEVIEQLMRYNVSSRQTQAGAERRFTERRADEARTELREAEDRLRRFLQANRDAGSPALRFEQDRLQREVTLRQQIYTTLAEAFERSRIEEVRDTPLLTVVEAPRVPARADGRGIVFKTALAFLVGGLLALLVVVGRSALNAGESDDPEAAELSRHWAATRDDLRHPIRAVASAFRRAPV